MILVNIVISVIRRSMIIVLSILGSMIILSWFFVLCIGDLWWLSLVLINRSIMLFSF